VKNTDKKRLIIVDGTSYLYRAYYVFSTFKSLDGKPSGAIYGVINMIRSLFLKFNPYSMVIVFDSINNNYRKKIYKYYKKNRSSMPESLKTQIIPLKKVINYLGIPVLILPTVEADDVIGTLSREGVNNGFSVIISSNDKDMIQLLNKNVYIIENHKKKLLGIDDIKEMYGIHAKNMNHYLALTGDPVDNIPGVFGIGKKTATILLNKFNTIQNIYKNLKKIKSFTIRGRDRIIKNLRTYKKNAFLSLKLATINIKVNLRIKIQELMLSNPKIDLLLKFFKEYQFVYFYKLFSKYHWFTKNKRVKIKSCKLINEKIIHVNHFSKMILNKREFDIWLDQFKKVKSFSFFFDVIFLKKINFFINGIVFSNRKSKFNYLVFKKNTLNIISELNIYSVFKKIKNLFENEKICKITENLKFQYRVLNSLDIKITNTYCDTMLELHIFKVHNLKNDINSTFVKNNILTYFKKVKLLENSVLNCRKLRYKNSSLTSLDHIKKITKKSYFILKTHNKIIPLIKKYKQIFYLYKNIDIPLVKSLFKMELHGVLIDCNILNFLSKKVNEKLKGLEEKAHFLSGKIFNLSSAKQTQDVLFKKNLFNIKNNKGKSTKKSILLSLSKYDPLPKIIIEYRSLRKLKSTYIEKLFNMIQPSSKRIHTSYYQTVTNTGRISSKNPNLQNIPINKKKSINIRTAFIAPKDFIIMSADYSQIELRIIAHLSKDKALVCAFKTGKDIHNITASDLFNVSINSVTFEQRKIAKTINFSLIYGISAFGLAQKLDIEIVSAEKYIDLYFSKYKGVQNYIETIKCSAKENGYVTTLDKRKLYIDNIQSNNKNYIKAAERVAINAPIQGTAADIIKKAMIRVNNILEVKFPKDVRMVMQVHDELVFEVRKDRYENVSHYIRKHMESCSSLNVPLKVNIKKGNNWNLMA